MNRETIHSVEGTPVVLHRADWAAHDLSRRGRFEGRDIGIGVSVLFFSTDELGQGPNWHMHPYDEIFIVRKGCALFTIGSRKIQAKAGDILLGPANIPHKFHNLGLGRLETTDIHLHDHWIQIDLQDPELEPIKKRQP